MSYLYRQFATQDEIDAQYDVESSVPDFMVYARHYMSESQVTRDRLQAFLDVPYGPTLAETVDIFPANAPNAPVVIFIHGGYWRLLSSKEFSCVAKGLQQLGITTVVMNYALTPSVSIDEITRQSRACVAWVYRNISTYGGNPQQIILSGHSAGGHLTAMCLQTDWQGLYGLPANPLIGGVLVSGLYDLEPIRYTKMQPLIQLDDGVIRRNSPLFSVRKCPTPILVTWGGDEPDEFRRQSDAFIEAWQSAGNTAVRLPLVGKNHFNAIDGFERPESEICQWIQQLL